MTPNTLNALILLSLWLVYFIVHSILASLTIKQWVAGRYPSCMPYYRLSFNIVAVILVVVPVVFMRIHQTDYLWQWQGMMGWSMNALSIIAVLLFVWSLSFYDSGEFLGIRQIKNHVTEVQDQEHLYISPLHRFVRHPWYSLALAILWTRDMDLMLLVSAIAITIYFKLGSMLEEKKLIAYHGSVYEQYCHEVPGLIPLPWRFLSKSRAQQLISGSTNREQ